MTKASRDTQGGRKVKRGKKERKKERKKDRGRERERREKKKAGVPSYEESSRDIPKKERGDPEYSIQANPKKQREKGGGKGKGGTKLATGSNEPCPCSTRCTSPPSKLAQRASERERERESERASERASEGGREGGREEGGRRRGKHGKNSKISNQRCVLHLQASLCKASEREREKEGQAWQEFQSTRCTSSPSMSRIPINEVYFVSINEVYFVSKHVKNATP